MPEVVRNVFAEYTAVLAAARRSGRAVPKLLLGALLLTTLAACGITAEPDPEPEPLGLSGISPDVGGATTLVTVTGENIEGDARVRICDEFGTNVVVRNAAGDVITGDTRTGTSVEFNPPTLTPDTVCNVVVIQGEGDATETATLAGAFTYEAEAEPQPEPLDLTSVSPSQGDADTLVTLTGENIAGDATVEVCGQDATNVVVRDVTGDAVTGDAKVGTSIEFRPPLLGGDAVCDVVVRQGDGAEAETGTLADAFTYVFEEPVDPVLSLTGISPATGDSETLVTVTGENIAGNATVQVCHVSGTDVVVRNPAGDVVTGDAEVGTTLEFNPPVLTGDDIGPDGTCDVIVTQGDGESYTLQEVFTYDFGATPLVLTGITPTSGDENTRVTITGENIAGDATVRVCLQFGTDVVVRDASGEIVTGDDETGTTLEFNPPVLTEDDVAEDGTCDVIVRQHVAETGILEEVFTYLF